MEMFKTHPGSWTDERHKHMRYDIVERAQRAHLVDGFCEIINCPECEVRRRERLAPGKELRALKSDLERQVRLLQEADAINVATIHQLLGEAQGLRDSLAEARQQLAQCQQSREFWMEQAFSLQEQLNSIIEG